MTKTTAIDPGEQLFLDACTAYGIGEEFILSKKYYPETGEVVIVTMGGAKVRFSEGQKVEKLDPVRVTGISPRKFHWVAGKKRG